MSMKGPPAAEAGGTARVSALRAPRPAAAALLSGGWYDSCRCPLALPTLVASLQTGCLVEFEISDTGFDPRGHGLCELLGQGHRTGGEPYYVVEPITADTPALEAWALGALRAPNGLVICVGPAPALDLSREVHYMLPVEMLRVVSQEVALREWGGVKLLEFLRAREARARALPALPPEGLAGRARPRLEAAPLRDTLEPEMRGVHALEAELLDGAPSRRRPREMPSLAELPAFPPAPPHAPPGADPLAAGPGGASTPAAWGEAAARAFCRAAKESGPRGSEAKELTVRERLSARHGTLATRRAARRILREFPGPADLVAPSDSEGDGLGDDRKRRRKREKRKRRKRKKQRRSSSGSSRRSTSDSSRTGSDEELFRSAPGNSGTASRAQRDALERPHVVLVQSLAEISRLLPSTTPGARLSTAQISRSLPALYVPFMVSILERRLSLTWQGPQKERECRTLCEMLDCLLRGDTLGSMMIGLGRLKAIEHALSPDHGGWNVASHMELAPAAESGLVTSQDRAAAARDQRDHQRTLSRGGGQHQHQWRGAGRGDRRRAT